ncbi:type 1 fimbrial protein [Lysobacter pythonis]|uniref:Type 1 fimbrial protein n=1 Tax=Solilutibacter pythonis TaxID=2483112 RepID=A0A3M2HMI9_9GAMM|nr:fimbrial protein [Lysobacter pythonis]RMH90931.1 type 1 fimbrial protein [Lysobacter pythonis]
MRQKNLLAALLLATVPVAASAADGTITFTGKITDKTCTISTASKNLAVALPTVSKTTLNAAGKTAGRTPFSLKLTGCTASSSVAAYFEPGDGVDITTGRLKNQATSSAASNVQIQLLGANSMPLLVKAAGADGVQGNSQWVVVDSSNNATLDYYAEYYATNSTTAGEVKGSVAYTITYK